MDLPDVIIIRILSKLKYTSLQYLPLKFVCKQWRFLIRVLLEEIHEQSIDCRQIGLIPSEIVIRWEKIAAGLGINCAYIRKLILIGRCENWNLLMLRVFQRFLCQFSELEVLVLDKIHILDEERVGSNNLWILILSTCKLHTLIIIRVWYTKSEDDEVRVDLKSILQHCGEKIKHFLCPRHHHPPPKCLTPLLLTSSKDIISLSIHYSEFAAELTSDQIVCFENLQMLMVSIGKDDDQFDRMVDKFLDCGTVFPKLEWLMIYILDLESEQQIDSIARFFHRNAHAKALKSVTLFLFGLITSEIVTKISDARNAAEGEQPLEWLELICFGEAHSQRVFEIARTGKINMKFKPLSFSKGFIDAAYLQKIVDLV